MAAPEDIVRGFNRFYTRQIGLLREGLLETPYSLTQARVLFELGTRHGVRSTDLIRELGLDPGYLSRLLKAFERQLLITRSASKEDRRVNILELTEKGYAEFKALDTRSQTEAREMLARLSSGDRDRLAQSMTAIRSILDSSADPTFTLRTHRPGDIGWVVRRHGEIYDEEYQWDCTFEGLVAKIAGEFLIRFDPARERCWIADRAGERLGCIFLVKQSVTVAKLRLLLVEPSARGLGVGTRLVNECIAFARERGYRRLTLWTNSNLHAARRIYERAAFRLVKEEKHHSFGHDLTGQNWELRL